MMLTLTLPALTRAAQARRTNVCRSVVFATSLLKQQARLKSTLTTVKPSPDAPRQVPTPIMFLAAQAFHEGAQAKDLYAAFIEHFSAQGYESIVIDLDPDEVKGKATSKDILDAYEKDMSSLLRTASPFPPVLFTGYLSSLIAEQYASSHPLSSLLLLDPPLSSSRAHKAHQALLPTPFEEYNFEPRFPCRVIWSSKEMARQKAEAVPWYEAHRIEHAEEEKAGEALDKIVWEDVDKEGPEEVQKWLEEECGVLESPTSDAVGRANASEEHDEDEEEEAYAEDEGEEESSLASSRSASRSASGTQDTLSGRFLLPGNQLPEWFTCSTQYKFTSSRKLPLELDESHLRETFNRGGGKGGQAINKNKSRCDLLHLPTGAIVRCQEERALERNRVLARRRMSVLLEEGLRASQGAGVRGGEIDEGTAPSADGGGGAQARLGEARRMSVKEKAREKERKKKLNKKKKQKKRMNEKLGAEAQQSDETTE